MAAAYAGLREAAGQGRTDAFAASELPTGRTLRPGRGHLPLRHHHRGRARRDLASGHPSWHSPPWPTPRWPRPPRTPWCSTSPTSSSVVQTVFATTTLMLLRASLGRVRRRRRRPGSRGARRAAPRSIPRRASVEQISFLGRHWAYGVAQEAALKLPRGLPALDGVLPPDGVPPRAHRHRPARPGRLGDGRPRARPGRRHTPYGRARSSTTRLDPVADLVRAQILAVDRAEARRPRPRPAAQPRPLRRPRRLVILCVCLSPAVDVTYHVDHLHPSGTTRVSALTERPGGKAVNVARVLHRLGEPTRLVAPAGGGTGDQLRRGLAAAGLDATLVPTGHPTRRTVTVVERDGAAPHDARRAGRRSTAGRRSLEAVDAALADADVLVVSGSVPDGVPADGLAVSGLGRSPPLACPSSSTRTAPGCSRPLAAGADLVKPNVHELAAITGDDDPVRAARSAGPLVRRDRRGLPGRGRCGRRHAGRRLGSPARGRARRQPHGRRGRAGGRPGSRAAARPAGGRRPPSGCCTTPSPCRPPPSSLPRRATSTRRTTRHCATASSSVRWTVRDDRGRHSASWSPRRSSAAAPCRPST